MMRIDQCKPNVRVTWDAFGARFSGTCTGERFTLPTLKRTVVKVIGDDGRAHLLLPKTLHLAWTEVEREREARMFGKGIPS